MFFKIFPFFLFSCFQSLALCFDILYFNLSFPFFCHYSPFNLTSSSIFSILWYSSKNLSSCIFPPISSTITKVCKPPPQSLLPIPDLQAAFRHVAGEAHCPTLRGFWLYSVWGPAAQHPSPHAAPPPRWQHLPLPLGRVQVSEGLRDLCGRVCVCVFAS